ncbi:M14-type cytosolic carboxypeptidase [Chitinivorax sp. B]|uniref:M14 family metallopeptidase n=1 Tax=Chitinivorax sp. B TaxID=2502235 RepID=UPI0010FA5231|nr:M14-type cytosolic carboxypeptidase [Chitinivorax sp. B]
MKISTHFDAGSIEVINTERADDIQLKIRQDSHSDFLQWFYFRLQGAANQPCSMRILNAGETSYAKGWEDYRAVASYDREHWFRVSTRFDGKEMVIDHTPQANSVYYAYFEPYSHERHLDLIGMATDNPWCEVEDLGCTVDGRDFDMLIVGDQDPAKRKIWVTARQHPGETMAEWFVEGLLERLLDEDDAIARSLLAKANFYIVPNMNPDGSVRGNLRTNAAGANLNREWMEPSMDRSPEVFLVRQKMHQIGVDLFLDAHGDEALPYIFVAGCEGNPNYSDRLHILEDAFKRNLALANPDFQDKFGYERDKPGEANLTLATNYVGQHFDCLAYTLEMPFKDNANLPDEEYGWSGERSKKLGASTLQAFLAVIDQLR